MATKTGSKSRPVTLPAGPTRALSASVMPPGRSRGRGRPSLRSPRSCRADDRSRVRERRPAARAAPARLRGGRCCNAPSRPPGSVMRPSGCGRQHSPTPARLTGPRASRMQGSQLQQGGARMKRKVYDNAGGGARRPALRRHDHRRRRLRPLRHPRAPDRRDPRRRRQGPHRRLQQRRRRRLRPRRAAADPAGQEDDLLLRRRERRVHAPVPLRRARARVQPAGHARRADARRRRRHPGLLHQDRRRHRHRRGQGAQGVRRRDLHPRARHRRRPRDRQGLEGRRAGQPRLPQDRAQLQSERRHLRPGLRRRGRGDRAARPLDPDGIHTPGIFVHRILQGPHEKRIEQRTVRAA